MSKLPAMQFYPADWRKDIKVQSLSFEERGVWFELLCLMHESEERGKLVMNKKPIDEGALARLIGCDEKVFRKIFQRILRDKVAYRTRSGVVYNKRMVEDERIRKIRRDAGLKGGSPILLNQKVNHHVNQVSNQNPTPSASASSSTSNNKLSSEQIFEYLRSATFPEIISDKQIHEETLQLIKKYRGKPVNNLRSLCNEWAGNIKPKLRKELVQ